jgi:inosine-uridine nucleoside N-ribohydrolase
MPRLLLRACFALFALLIALPSHAAPADDGKRRIIIDQDAFGPASSNLQAILMLLQSPDVEVLGIVATSGDGWRDEEMAHVLRLLEIAKRTDVPVYGGAVFPLVNTQARTRVWEQLYGPLYYKGAWTESWPDQGAVRRTPYHADPFLIPPSPAGAPKLRPQKETGMEFMSRSVRRHPHQVTIWVGGPLSTVALAARSDPQLSRLARELVFMGGSFNPMPADNHFANEYVHNPRREFNMRWDPEAASLVLHEPWAKITELPIDPTTRTFFKKEFFAEIAQGDAAFAGYLEQYGQSFPMWDELAAAIWLDPTLATRSETMLVDVDTSFTAGYGNTLSWPLKGGPGLGEREVLVIQDVDVPRFERMTLDLLSRKR